MLATLLSHGVRREERCQLRVRALQRWDVVYHFRRYSKADKSCDMPVSRSVPEDGETLWGGGNTIPWLPQLR
jgi:hypothetical protein